MKRINKKSREYVAGFKAGFDSAKKHHKYIIKKHYIKKKVIA